MGGGERATGSCSSALAAITKAHGITDLVAATRTRETTHLETDSRAPGKVVYESVPPVNVLKREEATDDI